MTAHFISGLDGQLLPLAASRIPHFQTADMFGPSVTLGVASGPNVEDKLWAIFVFHMYVEAYRSCQVSLVSFDPHWATRNTVRTVLSVPFDQYDCNRVWVAIPHTNERMIKLIRVLGFTQEGALREGFGPGIHAVVCSILRREYEWRYRSDGKKFTVSTRAT